MQKDDLIAALEAADEPSRELDAEVAVASGQYDRLYKTIAGVFVYRDDGQGGQRPPRYTSSIDAALTLVPEGWHWSTNSGGTARIWVQGVYYAAEAEDAAAATPALAICIAALKAGEEG